MTGPAQSLLVLDVGTSGVRAAIVRPDATVDHVHYRQTLPSSPAPGFVEFDPAIMRDAVLDVARAALAAVGGAVGAVGVTNQRASTIVWDRATGQAVGPGVGWQDLRTAGMCLALREQGLRLAPNLSATKLAFLLDMVDPDRRRDLCFGTVDSWVVWALTEGRAHVTDLTNAGVTGLVDGHGTGWDPTVLDALRIPVTVLPRIVDSSGVIGHATALAGEPPIAGVAGDQQASLLGQGCTRPGQAKATFGTGAMLDLTLGPRPAFAIRGDAGTFPVVAWRLDGEITWGIEAIMLAAGTNVEWMRDDLGVVTSAAASHEVASRCAHTGGVVFVPALVGLGTPAWDYGARGALLGVTLATGRPEVVRAVLEGVAQRGADLVEAAEADSGLGVPSLRVDGGMSANPTFLQALADAAQRPIEVSPVAEATTLGAAFLAGLATGTWTDLDEIGATWAPVDIVEPRSTTDRERWRDACRRASGWLPELSAIEF